MYITVTESMFRDEFRSCGRQDQFSHEALGLLFEHLNELEDFELDVIEICCEYEEASAEDVIESYGVDVEEGDDLSDAARTYLEDHTTIIGETSTGFVFAQF